MKPLILVTGLLVCLAAFGEPLAVGVGILPQAYLAERIGGGHLSVSVLVGPGQNYHTYEPTPKQLADLAGSSVYFEIGFAFEQRLVEKITAANAKVSIVDQREGITLRAMDEEPCESDHGHGTQDPHVWMNPRNMQVLGTNMARALERIDGAHATEYKANLELLNRDLEALDRQVSATLAPFRGRTFYVYHPAFGYLADAYGLKQSAVEIEGKEPTARQLAALIERAKGEGVRAILVQQQFPRKAAETVAREIGGRVIAVDPLAKDYIAGIETIAQSLRDSWAP